MSVDLLRQRGAVIGADQGAPLNNVWEDPATGSAAASGAFLASLDPHGDVDLKIAVEQGLQRRRASAIEVQVRKRAGRVLEVTLRASAFRSCRE